MIKAVVFDAGGVLLNWDHTDFLNKAYKMLNINRIATRENHPPFPLDFRLGKMTIEEAMPRILGEKLDDNQIRIAKDFWIAYLAPKDEMRELVRRLKVRYKLAVLSNSDKDTMEHLVSKGVFGDFDVLVFSHEIGIVKPEQRIYDILLDKLKVPPEECVFIDDKAENLIPAKKMGMKTILFRNPKQCKEELRNLGIRF